MEKVEKALILDENAMKRVVNRIAYEIIEKNHGVKNVVIVGIKRRGVFLARKIADIINTIENVNITFGTIDIAKYRDDIPTNLRQPVNNAYIDFDVNGKDVILVDDVLCTGRTARAALNALIDRGRPSTVQLAVLIDRGHREMPIRADYIGKNIPTAKSESVNVYVDDIDGKNKVTISEGGIDTNV